MYLQESLKFMAKEQVMKLYCEVQANPSLRDGLNTAPDVEFFVTMANQRGFAFCYGLWGEG